MSHDLRAPLHQQIMNIPCELPCVPFDTDWVAAYRLGHRDARHAAAELAAAVSPPQTQGKRWTEVLCQKCGGNGVLKIPGGITQCPRCDGRCYEPETNIAGDPITDADLIKHGQDWGDTPAPAEPSVTLAGELKKLRAIVEWQGDELSKRMACVTCGEEPHPRSELYSTVCPSCRMCFACCEPMCPTCGDRDGTKQRAVDLRNENEKLRQQLEAALAASRQGRTQGGS